MSKNLLSNFLVLLALALPASACASLYAQIFSFDHGSAQTASLEGGLPLGLASESTYNEVTFRLNNQDQLTVVTASRDSRWLVAFPHRRQC